MVVGGHSDAAAAAISTPAATATGYCCCRRRREGRGHDADRATHQLAEYIGHAVIESGKIKWIFNFILILKTTRATSYIVK